MSPTSDTATPSTDSPAEKPKASRQRRVSTLAANISANLPYGLTSHAFAQHLRWLHITAGLSAFVLTVLYLGIPLFSMLTIDWILANRAVDSLNVLFVGLTTVFLFAFLIKGLQHYVCLYMARRANVVLAEAFFEGAEPDAQQLAKPETLEQLENLKAVRNFYSSGALVTFWQAGMSVIFLGVLFLVDPLLAAVCLTSLPLFALLAYYASSQMQADKPFRLAKARYNKNVFELLTASGDAAPSPSEATDTPSYGEAYQPFRKSFFARTFAANWVKMLNAWFLTANRTRVVTFAGEALKGVILLTVFYLGARMVMVETAGIGGRFFAETLTVGGLVAVVLLTYYALTPFAALPGAASLKQRASNALAELQLDLTTSSESLVSPGPSEASDTGDSAPQNDNVTAGTKTSATL